MYANNQRIWLRTFKTEKEAAMAYDSAAIKLRSGDSHRNYPWNSINVEGPNFQNLYSAEGVLNMIKDGSYQSKFTDYLKTCSKLVEIGIGLNPTRVHTNEGLRCRQLFGKELTPSNVGKLNRLVIPKKYAIKYFQHSFDDAEDSSADGGAVDNVQLVFYDRLMGLWKFLYCYWRSSQSFVFTWGWNQFFCEKELKANDTILFYMCESNEVGKKGRAFSMIDVKKSDNNVGVDGAASNRDELQMDLQLQFGQNVVLDKDENEVEEEELTQAEAAQDAEEKSFRSFGVQIN